MQKNNKVFINKTYGNSLYKWSPQPTDKTKTGVGRPFYCTATPNSQGQDWIVNYVYDIVINNFQQERSGYVECGYVE